VGDTNARGFTVGATFTLVDHPRESENQEYLVTSARVQLKGQEGRGSTDDEDPSRTTFVCIDAKVTFRPPRVTPKPIMRGPQTAVVVGPDGQEIWTDQYGRVKGQFHWDRLGESDENSSCWIRVGQQWAGGGFGAQFIPRIGHEVIVDFLEGDPDKPIVTGSVYNGSNMPPFDLPNGQTQSGWRSRSTPMGSFYGGNQSRVEDAKGAEELYLHAEKAQTTSVNGNQTLTVGGSRTLTVGVGATEGGGALGPGLGRGDVARRRRRRRDRHGSEAHSGGRRARRVGRRSRHDASGLDHDDERGQRPERHGG
jgi:type VI secretion system secreted protein VgrG